MQKQRLIDQLARYGGLSVVSACISLGLPFVLHQWLGVDPRLAVAIGLICAFTTNFFGLSAVVFGHTGGIASALARFLGVALVFRGLEYLGFLLLFDIAHLPYMVALLIPLVISFCLKFVTYRVFVFRPAQTR